jgi:hypothetical protein
MAFGGQTYIPYRQWPMPPFAARWLDRFSDRICDACEVDQEGIDTGIRPTAHVGRKISVPINPRNSAASGQSAENAGLTRLEVSLTRAAIFSNRSRMVENSLLASGCGLGIRRKQP